MTTLRRRAAGIDPPDSAVRTPERDDSAWPGPNRPLTTVELHAKYKPVRPPEPKPERPYRPPPHRESTGIGLGR